MSKEYDLCKICGHTPAFCYCKNTYGLSRAECLRRQQEVIRESIFNDPEMQCIIVREMINQMDEECQHE